MTDTYDKLREVVDIHAEVEHEAIPRLIPFSFEFV